MNAKVLHFLLKIKNNHIYGEKIKHYSSDYPERLFRRHHKNSLLRDHMENNCHTPPLSNCCIPNLEFVICSPKKDNNIIM